MQNELINLSPSKIQISECLKLLRKIVRVAGRSKFESPKLLPEINEEPEIVEEPGAIEETPSARYAASKLRKPMTGIS